MTSRKSMLRIARRISLILGLLFFGALLFAVYLDRTMTEPPEAVRNLLDAGILAYLLIFVGVEPRPSKAQDDPSSAFAGPAALLVTSLFAAGIILRNAPDMLLVASLVALSGLVSALLLWRFARSHPGEIGEARFGPDGKPLGPWQPPKS